jgi:hypothetical protein
MSETYATAGTPGGTPGCWLALIACVLTLAGCGPRGQQPAAVSTASQSAAQTGGTQPVAPAPQVPAPPVTQASWAPDALQQLVAPIALYPDQIVGQILAASVNPQEVLDAGNWLLQNGTLKGDALDAAAQKAGLGPAMLALVQFPTVVDMMCQQIDWTRQLGAAFTSDQKGVLDAVQLLRAQAARVGNLQSTPQQTVETRTENEKTVIEVKPADPQVVYVPQYNPQVVYTTPPPPPPPAPAAPQTSTEGTVSTGTAVAGGLLAFGVGVMVGNAIHSNDCYPHWGAGAVFVGPRPFYPPAYVYRPTYGPGFRPAYRYAPPPNYRYAYNNINVRRNTNINVNNNYFDQFNHNRNLSGVTRNTGPAWKGQSAYAGARPAAQAQLSTAQSQRNAAELQRKTAQAQRNVGQTQRDVAQTQRNVAQTQRNVAQAEHNTALTQRNVAQGNVAQAQRNISAPQREAAPTVNNGGSPTRDRGYGGSDRTPNGLTSPPNQAFSGASNAGGGAFDRASSARGHASAGHLLASGRGIGRNR